MSGKLLSHLVMYKSDFTSYSLLTPPIFLNMKNQQQFPAIRCGTLVVQVSNWGTMLELTLHRALHVPVVSYTLVSIAALNKEGYHTHIGTGHMELTSLQGECIGHIPRMPRHLYKVVHVLDSANAVEPLSAMELHRHLSHIAIDSACKLVTSGTVIGIELDSNLQDVDCDGCIFAWATWLFVPKVRICLPAQNFGDEIHTNVWGPSSTVIGQGKQYIITFMDDTMRYTVTFLLRTTLDASTLVTKLTVLLGHLVEYSTASCKPT